VMARSSDEARNDLRIDHGLATAQKTFRGNDTIENCTASATLPGGDLTVEGT
jgi:hypothetical protein